MRVVMRVQWRERSETSLCKVCGSKRRLEALSRRYPGKLELSVPHGATPVTLRMQALAAARFDDILAHVTFTGAGSKDSRLYPLWDQTRIWDPGD